ncbi:MAG: DUF1573 domain-containing protein [Bacteroidales bacterium]|nr:DUF1573 domain-containing protein [Bacteroidales bacterium]
MKLQKLIMLTIAVFAFSYISYGQVEPAEAPMFGNVRGVNSSFSHNFGKVTGTVQSYNFKIKNTGSTPMHIIDIKLPEKIGVTVIDMHIQPGQEGVITATVDPTVMNKGKFTEQIIITTKQKDKGITTTKEIPFIVAGEVK